MKVFKNVYSKRDLFPFFSRLQKHLQPTTSLWRWGSLHICMQHMVLVSEAGFPNSWYKNFARNCKVHFFFPLEQKKLKTTITTRKEELSFSRTVQTLGVNESNIVTFWRRKNQVCSITAAFYSWGWCTIIIGDKIKEVHSLAVEDFSIVHVCRREECYRHSDSMCIFELQLPCFHDYAFLRYFLEV